MSTGKTYRMRQVGPSRRQPGNPYLVHRDYEPAVRVTKAARNEDRVYGLTPQQEEFMLEDAWYDVLNLIGMPELDRAVYDLRQYAKFHAHHPSGDDVTLREIIARVENAFAAVKSPYQPENSSND